MDDRSQLLETIERQSLFDQLPAEDRERVARLAVFATLRAGESVTDEGAPVSGLWILLEGRMSVEVGLAAERTRIAALGAGSLLGEASYLSGRPASATVTALSDCRLLELPQDRVRVACEQHPSFGLRFERLLVAIFSERLSRTLGSGTRADLPAVDAESLTSLRTLPLQPIEEEAVARYSRFGKRDPFLWRWCLRALELTTVPSVPQQERLEVRTAKFLAAVTLVIVDDVADLGRAHGELEEALALLGHAPAGDHAGALDAVLGDELTWMWSTLRERTGRFPFEKALAPLLDFDWQMVFTANRYARLARHVPAIDNPTENIEFAPHGIALFVFGTLDLMTSPQLTLSDLRATRELVHAGQTLCELANMIATWRRELPDRDFGSRIFTLGLTRGTFTNDELQTLPTDTIIARIEEAHLEEQLLEEWRTHRSRAQAAASRIDGYDPSPLIAGYDMVFGLTLAARGSI
jgi:CRP/FNR family cyclic AMP-dependent transcriptional regulator